MTFSPGQIEQLSAKLDRSHVKDRMQAGRKLSYVEGWHAIAEANRIFGFDAWTRETLDLRMVSERERPVGQGQGWGVTYIAKVRVIVDGVAREGVGAGHGIDRDLGLAHESAAKEAETDAMKRALMTFGNPFGLALYDKTQENVETPPEPATGRNAAAAPSRTSTAPAAPSFTKADLVSKIATFDLMSDLIAWANSDPIHGAYSKLTANEKAGVDAAYDAQQAKIEAPDMSRAAE